MNSQESACASRTDRWTFCEPVSVNKEERIWPHSNARNADRRRTVAVNPGNVRPAGPPTVSKNRNNTTSSPVGTRRSPQLKFNVLRLPILLLLPMLVVSCASNVKREASPAEKLVEAQSQFNKGRYTEALNSLDGMESLTAGTALGGEVTFLLGEVNFRLGKYVAADSSYSSYGLIYPGGPHASEALFRRAMAKVREIEKTVFYFFGIKKVIPADRDITPIREARLLFTQYLDRFPEGKHAVEASKLVNTLLEKEGAHEIGIASFYLRKGELAAALSRASAVLDGNFPPQIKEKAGMIVQQAKALMTAQKVINAPGEGAQIDSLQHK